MNLDKIPREEFSRFLEAKFKNTNFTLEKGVVDRVLDLAEDYPYNVQFLCHKLLDMNLNKKKINISDVRIGIGEILSEETPFYLSLWDNLTLHQRNVLRAIANFGGKRVFSHEFISSTGIEPGSTLQTSIRLLIKKKIIEKNNGIYEITDVFFKEWIKKETF